MSKKQKRGKKNRKPRATGNQEEINEKGPSLLCQGELKKENALCASEDVKDDKSEQISSEHHQAHKDQKLTESLQQPKPQEIAKDSIKDTVDSPSTGEALEERVIIRYPISGDN